MIITIDAEKSFDKIMIRALQKVGKEETYLNIPKLILRGHHHPETKTRQKYHKKRKLQANIADEHRHTKKY